MIPVSEIEGVRLTPLKIIEAETGSVRHGMKNGDMGFRGIEEVYFSTVKFGAIKGWKKHLKMTLNLIAISGIIKFILYDERETSKSYEKTGTIQLSLDNYQRLTVPPGIWVSFSGLDRQLNMLVNIANMIHNPDEALNLSIDDEKFPKVWA
jgi:dTDP-4-dehydrorhamnose 3,5-epimerase